MSKNSYSRLNHLLQLVDRGSFISSAHLLKLTWRKYIREICRSEISHLERLVTFRSCSLDLRSYQDLCKVNLLSKFEWYAFMCWHYEQLDCAFIAPEAPSLHPPRAKFLKLDTFKYHIEYSSSSWNIQSFKAASTATEGRHLLHLPPFLSEVN